MDSVSQIPELVSTEVYGEIPILIGQCIAIALALAVSIWLIIKSWKLFRQIQSERKLASEMGLRYNSEVNGYVDEDGMLFDSIQEAREYYEDAYNDAN